MCIEGEKCLEDTCSARCTEDKECPFDWQICSPEKICVDRCSILECANCKFGICGYPLPEEKCISDADCSNEAHSCIGLRCVDECIRTRCESDHECFKGECRPT